MLHMRKSKEQKAETRQQIIEAAGTLFRRHGLDAVGVDAIMRAAGLTHGGFYGHFPSKEALVAEVAAASLTRAAARWERISQEGNQQDALERIVGSYLDPAHVAAVEQGCMLTTLGPEVARRPEARPALTGAVRQMLEALETCLPPGQRNRAMTSLSCMVGAVVLARLIDDPTLSAAFLSTTKEAVCS
jgi:TetR/AcrR family transcriptional repressor of nem operon